MLNRCSTEPWSLCSRFHLLRTLSRWPAGQGGGNSKTFILLNRKQIRMQIFVCTVGSSRVYMESPGTQFLQVRDCRQVQLVVFLLSYPYERWQLYSCEWSKGLFLTSRESSLRYMYNELSCVIVEDSSNIKMATVINNFTIWFPTLSIQFGVFSPRSLTIQFKDTFLYSLFSNFNKEMNQDHSLSGIMAYNIISFLNLSTYIHFLQYCTVTCYNAVLAGKPLVKDKHWLLNIHE